MLVFILFAQLSMAADIYVSPTGSDKNDGSKEKPFATLNMALHKARELENCLEHTLVSP